MGERMDRCRHNGYRSEDLAVREAPKTLKGHS